MHLRSILYGLATLGSIPTSLAVPTHPDEVSLEPRASGWFRLAHYKVQMHDLIGRGASAQVFSIDIYPTPDPNKKYCVKVHHGLPDIIPPFQLLSHTLVSFGNVITTYAGVNSGPTQYIIMEQADESIEDRIRRGDYRGSNADELIKHNIVGMVRGLQTLHHAGLVHNDAHSANVVFVNDSPKLIDFDLITRAPLQPGGCGRDDIQGPGRSISSYYVEIQNSNSNYCRGLWFTPCTHGWAQK
jgi:serine/threonine protein kinase